MNDEQRVLLVSCTTIVQQIAKEGDKQVSENIWTSLCSNVASPYCFVSIFNSTGVFHTDQQEQKRGGKTKRKKRETSISISISNVALVVVILVLGYTSSNR